MTTDPKFYPVQIDDSIITDLQGLFTDSPWKWGYKYGETGDPCIRINRNTFEDTQTNPLNRYMNDNVVKNYCGNMLKPYQASFILYKKYIPNIQNNYYISHICGMAQEPSTYHKSHWNSCIRPQHMISELKPANLARKTCHRFIRLFKFKCFTISLR